MSVTLGSPPRPLLTSSRPPYGRSAFELIPEPVLSVGIDIKPDSSAERPINNTRNKEPRITVAVLSDVHFWNAANEVRLRGSSLRFGHGTGHGSQPGQPSCNKDAQDCQQRRITDLVCRTSNTSLTGFQVGDTITLAYLKALNCRTGIPIVRPVTP
jgi:hypothetical protein